TLRPRSRPSCSASLFSYPAPALSDCGRLCGSAQTLSTSAPCAGFSGAPDACCAPPAWACRAVANPAQIATAVNRTNVRAPSILLLLVDGCQPSGLDLAVGAALQVGVQAFPVLVHHLAGVERRHAFFDAAVHQRGVELFLGKLLHGVDQRWADEPFLFRAVTTLAGRRPPGLPACERLVVHLVAVIHRVELPLRVARSRRGSARLRRCL